MAGDPIERVRQLEAENHRLRTMLSSAPIYITRISADGHFQYLNRIAPGLTEREILGTHFTAYMPDMEHKLAVAALQRAVETHQPQTYAAMGKVSADRVGHYTTSISPIIEDGRVTSLVLVATDVTELREALQGLEESQTRLQLALDARGLGIWTLDEDRTAGTWDATARRILAITGDPPPAALVNSYMERIHPQDRHRVMQWMDGAFRTGSGQPVEHRIVLPDGTERWVSMSAKVMKGAEGRQARIVGAMKDITESRAFEARLLEAEKLESIGRLAGGIAHDFNNLLMAMMANLGFVMQDTRDESIKPLLMEVRHAAERSAALTAQLLAFARRQVIEPRVVDPTALVGRTQALLRRVIGEHIDMETALNARARVRVDPSQLEQVLLNLATNARDAMPGGGRLVITTRDERLGEMDVRRAADLVPGRYVALEVTDTGSGISADDLPHVFEPFFSTRSGGTGLGLATCHGIVKQNRGHITVRSEPGRGTTFTILLPAVLDAADPVAAHAGAEAVAPARGESILVVEDEDAVRVVVERSLVREGYRVRCVADPRSAPDVMTGEGPFDLLVTDVVMPGMGGRELADALHVRAPHLPVVYISGYAENAFAGSAVRGPRVRFLQKPFPPTELLSAVRELLDARGTSETRPR